MKFVKSQHVETKELQEKLKKGSITQKDLDLDNRMLNSALMECESEKMKKTILGRMHFLGKKIIKVREYMTKTELKSHIENIRQTRIFLDNIPFNVDNDALKKFFSKFGVVKIAYTTVKGKNLNSKKPKTGYLIFEQAGIIDKLDKSGIRMGNTVLPWHSFYHKNKD